MRLMSKKQLLYVLIYSLVFPIAQLLGAVGVSIFVALPFLAGAWLMGMVTASIGGSEEYYLVGATIAIFVQASALVWLCNWFIHRRNAKRNQ